MENKPRKHEMTGASVTVKALIIFALTLLMLIPQAMINGLIRERQERSEETIYKINAKWSHAQTLCGPVLSVPYSCRETGSDNKVTVQHHTLNITPAELNVNTKLFPEERYYGIYKTILYKSEIEIYGEFEVPDVNEIANAGIRWEDTRVKIGVSDLRGITDSFDFTFGAQAYPAEITGGDYLSRNTLVVHPRDLSLFRTAGGRIPFRCTFKLNGSSDINFIPVGRSTRVHVEGAWDAPGFIGSFMPEYTVGKGFTADWNILHFNRSIPDRWSDDSVESFDDTSFGVGLIDPVSHYQQNMRSAKYALMFIGLTFVVFFFVEILTRRRIHPIQYLLVGIALILFYSLLLSLSEQLGFGIAYLIASAATIALIIAYVRSIFRSFSQTAILALLLGLLYVYLYVVLQLEDIALLIGSIGLFVILGVIMFVSRKINWYKSEERPGVPAAAPGGSEK